MRYYRIKTLPVSFDEAARWTVGALKRRLWLTAIDVKQPPTDIAARRQDPTLPQKRITGTLCRGIRAVG